MKRIVAFILAFLCMITTMFSFGVQVSAADVDQYTPGTIIIPVEKTWADDNNAGETRPTSVTIKLYRYKGDSYTADDLYDTMELDGDMSAETWSDSFVVQNTDSDPAIYHDETGYHTYKFAIEEVPVAGYTETSHTDPSVNMSVTEGEWDRHTPNNDLEMDITTDVYPKAYIAIKGTGNKYYIWTPEPLSLLEQEVLEAFAETQAGYGGEEWAIRPSLPVLDAIMRSALKSVRLISNLMLIPTGPCGQ
jgi:hypothetical protein